MAVNHCNDSNEVKHVSHVDRFTSAMRRLEEDFSYRVTIKKGYETVKGGHHEN